jgi:hypothetical protein
VLRQLAGRSYTRQYLKTKPNRRGFGATFGLGVGSRNTHVCESLPGWLRWRIEITEEEEPKLRKLAIAVLGLFAVTAAGVALAQSSSTVVSASATVSPSKAGTKAHPQGVRLTVRVHWQTPADQDRPIIIAANAFFPKGSLYNGAKYPKCSADTMNRRGLSACPKGSIMGTGGGTAYADTVITHPQITIVNGGASNVCLYTTLNNPARVQACVPGTITRMSGEWAYKLHLVVPQVLQVVAGVPIQLTEFHTTAGKGSWLATTGCPASHKWPFSVQAFYSTGGSSTSTASTPCH